jgi:hypothetical protein
MISANSIRYATEDNANALRCLAELDSQQPLEGRVLIAHIDSTVVAALSLKDGRVIADPFQHTDHHVAKLRMRAGAIRAHEVTPSLRERLLAALPARRGNSVSVYP